VYVSNDEIHEREEGLVALIGQREIPLVDLEDLLGIAHDRRDTTHRSRHSGYPVMVVQLDSGALRAVRTQDVIDSRDIVVKDLGKYVPRQDGVLGATVLGDGAVASVIDLRELAGVGHGIASWNRQQTASTVAVETAATRTALVVDDSVSARRSTAQFMRDLGYEVRTAIDGLEAVGVLDKWVPDIVLTDMEMPRMNGLELSAYIRARDAVKHVPVIMITSRSTDKHRQQAEAAGVSSYVVKPFKDDVMAGLVEDLVGA
jgi:chemosensory pili system protein ChpA (sensor histidine kinase/response regulator)